MLRVGANFKEKREYARMAIDAELSCTLLGEGTSFSGKGRNISHSGIQFETDNLLAPGTSLEISIDSQSNKIMPMTATVNVLRVEPLEKTGFRVAGTIVEFK